MHAARCIGVCVYGVECGLSVVLVNLCTLELKWVRLIDEVEILLRLINSEAAAVGTAEKPLQGLKGHSPSNVKADLHRTRTQRAAGVTRWLRALCRAAKCGGMERIVVMP